MPTPNISQKDFDNILARFMTRQPDMILLLNTNGYYMPKDSALDKVQYQFLKAIKDSGNFRVSLADYMTKAVGTGSLNFAGADDVYLNDIGSLLGISTINPNYTAGTVATTTTTTGSTPPITPTTTTGSVPGGGTSSGGGTSWFGEVFNSGTVNNLLNTGLSALSTSLTSKANQKSEQNAIAAKQLDIQAIQEQQRLAELQAQAKQSETKGMPGWGWALIGLGAVTAVTIITVVIIKFGRKRAAK